MNEFGKKLIKAIVVTVVLELTAEGVRRLIQQWKVGEDDGRPE